METALLNGQPLRKIAKALLGIDDDSLFRHKTHVSEALKKAREGEKLPSNAESLKQQLIQLIADARRIQQAAEAAQDYRAALAGIREAYAAC